MSREHDERGFGTADLVSATEEARLRQEVPPEVERHDVGMADERAEPAQSQRDAAVQMRDDSARDSLPAQGEPLAALFDDADLSQDFRTRWSNVQIGFVDDPKRAVQQADELVAQVMKSLAESFARQRAEIEAGLGTGEAASTENLRVALQRYRSFFERLLSL